METAILEQVTLLKGSHDYRDDGVCAMELVAWLADEPHSDHPICASRSQGRSQGRFAAHGEAASIEVARFA